VYSQDPRPRPLGLYRALPSYFPRRSVADSPSNPSSCNFAPIYALRSDFARNQTANDDHETSKMCISKSRRTTSSQLSRYRPVTVMKQRCKLSFPTCLFGMMQLAPTQLFLQLGGRQRAILERQMISKGPLSHKMIKRLSPNFFTLSDGLI
jgi:hypothetical protein